MIPLLFFGLLGAFGLTYYFVGNRASKKMEDNEGYFLGGRNLGFFTLALTLLATQLGGGLMQGASEEAFSKGWIVLFYPAGMCLGFLALALGFGARLRSLGLSTVAELFEKVYGSPVVRKIASVISILTMFAVLVGQGVAARKFFGSLGYDTPFLYIGFWSLIIVYTVIGGLKAVVNTDVIKAIYILLVLVGVAVAAQFGLTQAMVTMPTFVPSSTGTIPWVAWLLMPLLFMVFEQDMAQRCFAAKSAKSVTLAGILASVLLFGSSLFSVYFGIQAAKLGIDPNAGKSVLFEAIIQLTSPVVSTFFSVAFVMIILSTADSLLCSVASNLAIDFSFGKERIELSKKLKGKRQVVISQALTLIVGLAAMTCSFFFDRVLPLLLQGYEFSVVTMFFPVTMALFLKRPRIGAAIASISMGAFGFFLFRIWEVPFPKEVISLALSFVGYISVQLYLSQRERALKLSA